jgi:hypothetical protein
MGVLLNRDSLGQGGGGFLNDVDAKIVLAEFKAYGFPNKAGQPTVNPPSPCLHLGIELEGGVVRDEWYSVGDAKFWAPNKNGKELEWIGAPRSAERANEGPSKSSKFGVFAAALGDALDADKLTFEIGDDIGVLVGMVAHWVQIPVPKYSGMKNAKVAVAGEREKTMGVIDKIVSLPGGASGTGAAGDDTDAVASDTLVAILDAAPGKTLTKAQIGPKAFAALKGTAPAVKQTVTKRMTDAAFLSEGFLWTFDASKGTVALNA